MNTRKFFVGRAIGFLVLVILAGGFFLVHQLTDHDDDLRSATTNYKDATYVIGGMPVTLVNGRAERPAAPGSASNVVTQYFGNEAIGDFNGDGTLDVAFLLTQSDGGSGTFYYAVVALKTARGYLGTNAVLLGDRVAPQTTEVHDGKLVVNYADRVDGEPMTTPPSVGKSLYLTVQGATLMIDQTAQ